jgi:hypothetical protein
MSQYVVVPTIFFILTICLALRLLIILYKFDAYLKDQHFEKWKYLTSCLGKGPGLNNPYRSIPFLFNKDNLGDDKVKLYKVKIRNALIYVLSVLMATPMTVFILFVIFGEQVFAFVVLGFLGL